MYLYNLTYREVIPLGVVALYILLSMLAFIPFINIALTMVLGILFNEELELEEFLSINVHDLLNRR